jgi:hypothetical protein
MFYHTRSILLKMRNVSEKICRENKNTLFMFNKFFFFENRAVNQITWKNILEPDTQQMAIWRMRIACWKPNATNTHSYYVIFIAFSLQQLLHERASMLCHTYIVCLVN